MATREATTDCWLLPQKNILEGRFSWILTLAKEGWLESAQDGCFQTHMSHSNRSNVFKYPPSPDLWRRLVSPDELRTTITQTTCTVSSSEPGWPVQDGRLSMPTNVGSRSASQALPAIPTWTVGYLQRSTNLCLCTSAGNQTCSSRSMSQDFIKH